MIDYSCEYCRKIQYEYMDKPRWECFAQSPDEGLVYCDDSKSYCWKNRK